MRFCEAPEGCKFPVFSTDKITRKGYCKSHALRYRTDLDRRTIIQRAMAKQKSIEGKVRGLGNEEKKVDIELDLWFRLQMNSHEKYCFNCGKSLYHYSDKDWKGSIHHVLEKSIFKSVMTNPINCLILCRWECHVKWHSSMMVASKMPCFEKAKEIVTLLYPLLTDNEKGRISEYYGDLFSQSQTTNPTAIGN